MQATRRSPAEVLDKPSPPHSRPTMPRRRHVLKTLGSGAAGMLLGACTRSARAQPSRLVVAAFPSIDQVARSAAPAWRARHRGVGLQVISRQVGDHHTAMMTALATGSELPDVMAIEVGYLGRFALGGGLLDLAAAPIDIGAQRAHYTPYAFDQASLTRGRVVAAPCDIGPGTMLARVDLLRTAGVGLSSLRGSWDDFVRAGQLLRKRTGAWLVPNARDVLDIAIRSGLAPGDGLYFDAHGRPALLSPRFVRGFELAARVRRLGLDARVQSWSPAWASGIRDGHIAVVMSGAWLAGHLASWLAPATAGRWRAAQLPAGSWSAYGGSFLAVPRRLPARRRALAWDFVRLLTLQRQRQLAAFASVDAFPALVDTYDDPFFDAPLPFLGGQRARRLWRTAAWNIRAVTLHAQDDFASEVVGDALYDVLDRGVAQDVALRRAQRLLQQRVGQA